MPYTYENRALCEYAITLAEGSVVSHDIDLPM